MSALLHRLRAVAPASFTTLPSLEAAKEYLRQRAARLKFAGIETSELIAIVDRKDPAAVHVLVGRRVEVAALVAFVSVKWCHQAEGDVLLEALAARPATGEFRMVMSAGADFVGSPLAKRATRRANRLN